MNLQFDMEAIIGSPRLSLADYIVVGVFLAFLLFCGMFHVIFSNSSPDHFLVGDRVMRSFPVAVSTAMLYISALAFTEYPAEIYHYGIESFMMLLITVVVVPVGAFLFVPMLYNMQLTSIHQYIGHRFDSMVLRCLTSLIYILQHLFLTCVVLASVSATLETYIGIPIRTSIFGIGAFAAANAALGGFKASVWTHVLQYICVIIFLLVLTVISGIKSGGFRAAFELAADNHRLNLFNFKIDPFLHHNFYNFLFGYGFLTLMQIVTYQPLIQRYSSLPSKNQAIKSLFMSLPLYIIPSLLCVFIGVFLIAAYAGCDPITFHYIHRPQDLINFFVRKNLSSIPGFTGFFTALIVGVGISVCVTAINSITACTYQDFISKLGSCQPDRGTSQTGQTTGCRFISVGYMAVSTLIVYILVHYDVTEKSLYPFSTGPNFITFNSVLYGPLAGVLLMAMFLPCINKYGALLGFLGGVSCMGYFVVRLIFYTNERNVAPLPPIMGDCPDKAELNVTLLHRMFPGMVDAGDEVEAALKLTEHVHDVWHLSYLLLPLFGAIITIAIGLPVSILTGGLCFCAGRKVAATFLHPLLRFSECCNDSGERQLHHAISHRYVDRITSPNKTTRLDSNPPSYKYSSVPNTPQSAN